MQCMQDKESVDWTEKQIILQRWLALPKRERKPKTIGLLSIELDVDESTIYRWKKTEGFADAVRELIKDDLKDDLSEVYAALRREAKGGSFQHIKLILEMVGDYVQKLAPTSPDGKEPYDSGITDEQRASRLAAILNAGRTRRDGLSSGDGPTSMATITRTAE